MNIYMTYHDQSQLNSAVRPELGLILDAPAAEKPQLFLKYCRTVIKSAKSGQITIDEAGYQIAETMFIKELNEPLFDEITTVAGDLELPTHISKVDPNEHWKRLIKLVNEYANRLNRG